MRKDKHTGRNLALGAMIAGVSGYVAGILTAPKSGKETRDDIADKAEEVKESAEEKLQDLHDDLQKLIKKTKSQTVALSSQARTEFNEAVIKAKDAKNKSATVLKSFKAGKASDPDLNKAIKQASQAKKNLGRFLQS